MTGGRPTRGILAAGTALLALACGIVAFRWAQPAPAPDPYAALAAVAPVTVPSPGPLTTEGLELFRERYRDRFGDTLVDEADFYPEHASLTRTVPDSPNRAVEYTYRHGFALSGAATTRPVDTPVVDLATLNVAAIGRYVAGAPASVGVPDGTVRHLAVDVSNGEPVVRIHVSNDARESGHLEIRPDGSPLAVWRFEP